MEMIACNDSIDIFGSIGKTIEYEYIELYLFNSQLWFLFPNGRSPIDMN